MKNILTTISLLALPACVLLATTGPASKNQQQYPTGSAAEAKNATIWFLGHCGFAVRTTNHLLIFDYVEKPLEGMYGQPAKRSLATGYVNPEEMKNLKVRVFATHSHTDHYDPVIFEWRKSIPDIQYFFGWKAAEDSSYHYLVGPRGEWKTDELEVYTVNSHHSGVPEVAYLVEVDGLVIYHNGDYRGDYKNDIPHLKPKAGTVDIAFVPPVWEERFEYYGLNLELIRQLRPKALFPMHVGVGDEEKYFAPFEKTFQPQMKQGRIVLTGNKKGAAFFFRDGVVSQE